MPDLEAPPAVSPGAEALYARLGPIAAKKDAENGYYALHRCEAIARMWQGLDQVILDSELYAGWTTILDPDASPAQWLSWAAVAVFGVSLVPGSTTEEQRDTLRDLPPQKRGTVEALVTDVAAQLIGTKTVDLTERPGGNAYAELIVTRTSETLDPAAALAAVRRQKIGGIKQIYETTETWFIAELEAAYESVAEVEAAFATVSDVEGRVI